MTAPEPPTRLSLWVVYDHPTDFPDAIVVREHWVTPEGAAPNISEQAQTFPDLTDARRWLADQGLTCIGRYAEDDPVITEVWL